MSDAAILSAATDDTAPRPVWRTRLLLAVVLLGAGAYIAHAIWHARHFEETDNAQVAGHVMPVLPRVSGFVSDVNVVENQQVKAGDILLSVDDRDYRSRLMQAEAELQALLASTGTRGQIGETVARIQAAEAQAQSSMALVAQAEADLDRAQKEMLRMRSLLTQKLVSTQQFDAADANERAAIARLQAARDATRAANEQVNVNRAALRGVDARVRAAAAARDIAQHNLDDTLVRAVRSGVISHKSVEPGQLVQTGQQLMHLVTLDDVWVIANMKETQIRDIATGNAAIIKVDAYPGMEWHGRVQSFSPATGARFTLLPPDNATGNFTKVVQRVPVKIQLVPGEHPQLVLRPGMSVSTIIERR